MTLALLAQAAIHQVRTRLGDGEPVVTTVYNQRIDRDPCSKTTERGIMSIYSEADDRDFEAAMQLNHRQLSDEQVRKFEGYAAEIFAQAG